MSSSEASLPSQVAPFLVAALVCDSASVDPVNKKKSLIGIFNAVSARKFPTKRPVTLYFKVSAAEGSYRFKIRFIQAETQEVLGVAEADVQIQSRLASSDFHLEFPPLELPREGDYEFQIWANDMFLGSASNRAVHQKEV